MGGGNGTAVNEFILLRFSGFRSLQGPLFWMVLCIYLVSLLGNFLIILLTDPVLYSPMYFFSCHFYTTTIMSRMLADLLSSCPTISPASCFTQLYFFALFGITECCMLTAMAYDCYAAVCQSLHYTTLMNWGRRANMVGACYFRSIITGTTHSIFILTLSLYGAHTTHHFLCDILSVLRLTSFWGKVGNLAITIAFILTPSSLIIVSYDCIFAIFAIVLGVSTSHGHQKVFSICSSHLFVVKLFFGTGGIADMRPAGSSQDADQFLALCYTVVTPMFNLYVYTLRKKEVTEAIRRLVKKYLNP
ncbi:LOW QUALITY PROTEIN: olfactory receptor 10P1 [Rhynchonycteris naso]